MSDDDGWLSEAIETGAEAARTLLTPFGTEREVFTCPDCGTACDPTHTHDPQRAAFDGGASPAWACPECDGTFVRETDDGVHTMDLYGRE
jgi:predicted RNA-binding Zn-ribbon protein involved in translation (DUF1610 family)